MASAHSVNLWKEALEAFTLLNDEMYLVCTIYNMDFWDMIYEH